MGLDRDTFVSLYDYDDYVVEYYTKNKSLSGFDGKIYEILVYDLNVPNESQRTAMESYFVSKYGM